MRGGQNSRVQGITRELVGYGRLEVTNLLDVRTCVTISAPLHYEHVYVYACACNALVS